MADTTRACCACLTVIYDPIHNANGTSTERWRCKQCGMEFRKNLYAAPAADPQPASVEAEVADYARAPSYRGLADDQPFVDNDEARKGVIASMRAEIARLRAELAEKPLPAMPVAEVLRELHGEINGWGKTSISTKTVLAAIDRAAAKAQEKTMERPKIEGCTCPPCSGEPPRTDTTRIHELLDRVGRPRDLVGESDMIDGDIWAMQCVLKEVWQALPACRKALDLLGVALADHDHQWTDEQRSAYDQATEWLDKLWPETKQERADAQAQEPAPVDRGELRERIAEVCFEDVEGRGLPWKHMPLADKEAYGSKADRILAILPAQTSTVHPTSPQICCGKPEACVTTDDENGVCIRYLRQRIADLKAQGDADEKLRRLRAWMMEYRIGPVTMASDIIAEIDRLLAEGKAEGQAETRTCDQCRNWSPR